MKTSFIVFVLTLIGVSARGDTIDFWHVYYNHNQIGDFTELSDSNLIKISSMGVSDNDTLHVTYFRDTPCHDCETHLAFYQGYTKVFESEKGRGTFSTLSVPLKELIHFKTQKAESLIVFYREEKKPSKRLFTLHLE